MSKIQAALVAVAAAVTRGFNVADYKTRGDLRVAIVKAANEMTDAQWGDLTTEAQDWFNEAADAVKASKVPAEFPDFEAEPETRSRRRSSAEPEQAAPAAAAGKATAVEDIEEGARVKITHKKRGAEKVTEGEVIEVSKRKGFLVVKDADGEVEIDFANVTATEVFHGTAAPEQEAADTGPAVGDTISFTTRRGKQVSGVIKELHADYLVLETGDDYDIEKIDGDITIDKKGAAAAAEPARRPRGQAADEKAEKAETTTEDDKPKRSSNPRGVSVGARIRELLAENPDMTEEAIGKQLTKDAIEFRPPTLNMIFKDSTFLISKLREAGHMKKAK